jgi:hypothetical protein
MNEPRARLGTLGRAQQKEEGVGGGRAMGRRLTRQDFLLLSAGAGAGLALAGCGGGPQNNPAVQGGSAGGGGKEYKGPKVTLEFWNGFTGGDGPFIQKMVEQFSSEHKNVQVKMNIIEWADYYQKVPTAVASGKGPDVGIMHCDQLGTNAARNVIIPLDPVAKATQRSGRRGSITASVTGYRSTCTRWRSTTTRTCWPGQARTSHPRPKTST